MSENPKKKNQKQNAKLENLVKLEKNGEAFSGNGEEKMAANVTSLLVYFNSDGDFH